MMSGRPRPLPNREAVFLDYLSDDSYNRKGTEENEDDNDEHK